MSKRLRIDPLYMSNNQVQGELQRLREKEIRNGWLSKRDQQLAIALIKEANRRNAQLHL